LLRTWAGTDHADHPDVTVDFALQVSQFRKLNEGMLYGTGLKARQ
jgi:hypothetical protein